MRISSQGARSLGLSGEGPAHSGHSSSYDQPETHEASHGRNVPSPDLRAFDDDQVAEPRVIKVGSTYRMYYTGRHVADNKTSLGLANSSDGLTFTKQATPILAADRWGNFWGGAFVIDRSSWHLWRGVTPDNGTTSYLVYPSSNDGLAWTEGPSNPVLTTNPSTTAADRGLVGDSVSGYLDGERYRIMYTGYNANLGGNQGRFEGICLAQVTSPCP